MNKSGKPKAGKQIFILSALGALLVLAIVSAGCIDEISPLPDEVKVRGNVLSVDPKLIPSETIVAFLLQPNDYVKEAFETVDKYLPADDPVIEIGAGPGTVGAYINKRLQIKTDHVSLESNPYLLPLLEKTKAANELGIRYVNGVIAYGVDTVPVQVTKNYLESNIAPTKNEETVDVPAYTLREIVDNSDFVDKGGVTVFIEVDGIWNDILKNEPNLGDFVSTLIVATWNISKNDREVLFKKVHNAGLVNSFTSDTGKDGLIVFVFKRYESKRAPSLPANSAGTNSTGGAEVPSGSTPAASTSPDSA